MELARIEHSRIARSVWSTGAAVALVAVALVVVALVAVAAPALADNDPFAIPKERFVQDIHTIVLAPTAILADVEHPAEVRSMFEKMATAELAALGIRVVASVDYERVWRTYAARLGGVFDPVAGIADKDKYQACRDYTARELGRTDSVDAIATLLVSRGIFPDGWDSRVVWRGGPLRTLDSTIRGTYLTLTIEDLAGTPLYSMQFPIEWTHVYSARSYEKRSDGEFRRELTNSRAVQGVIRDIARAYGKWPGASEPGHVEPAAVLAPGDGGNPAPDVR